MTSETRTFAEAAALLPDDFYLKCAKHFLKAVRKHPRFADALFANPEVANAEKALADARRWLANLEAHGELDGAMLAMCEIDEAQLASAKGDAAATIGELYDAVAVLMRMIAVVEGRQKLGGEE